MSSRDRYHWQAVYRDGTVIDEMDEHGEPRGFASVDREKVQAMFLLSDDPDDAPQDLDIPPDCLPICFRRRYLVDGVLAATIHCLGIEYPDGSCQYRFFLPDDSVILSDDLNAL